MQHREDPDHTLLSPLAYKDIFFLGSPAALLSFVFGLFGVLVMDWSAVREDGFFQGYSVIVGIVICLQVHYLCIIQEMTNCQANHS